MDNKITATNSKKLVMTALLTAIVVLLQLIAANVRFGPFSITLVLLPIVVGAAVCGVGTGAWLGLAFGIMVLATDSQAFLAVNPAGTVITVLVKGVLAGIASALVYKTLEGKNKYVAVVLASIVCPVVNTGIFLIGCNVFFMETITQWGAELGFESAFEYLVIGMVGINFIIELIVNIVLDPIIVRVIKINRLIG